MHGQPPEGADRVGPVPTSWVETERVLEGIEGGVRVPAQVSRHAEPCGRIQGHPNQSLSISEPLQSLEQQFGLIVVSQAQLERSQVVQTGILDERDTMRLSVRQRGVVPSH